LAILASPNGGSAQEILQRTNLEMNMLRRSGKVKRFLLRRNKNII
jgi:hypothetical protein